MARVYIRNLRLHYRARQVGSASEKNTRAGKFFDLSRIFGRLDRYVCRYENRTTQDDAPQIHARSSIYRRRADCRSRNLLVFI